ncbi:flavodoxin-dependent (E)-4-hydroxy-3-methylbut-2-enyl-diphosphate synthase [Candidatus Peregrinibacteria bacterium]|nr:flavodoxin-dependent (E)-4-hydroxy-3-methylbut-2-enyl-diphosphate synthase [Candidatus Peregrinibacteria bacterium]
MQGIFLRKIRKPTKICKVGDLQIGGKASIVIQSMTNTRTQNVKATVKQILALEREGCELIRVAVPDFEAAAALRQIKRQIHIPLCADIHFDYRLALEAIKAGVDKVRINPGNIGGQERVAEILKAAKAARVAVRLGINSGSLEQHLLKKYGRPSPKALVESALNWAKFFEDHGFTNFIVSIKSSDVLEAVEANRLFAKKSDYPLHLGITEAGLPPYGIIKSAVGIGALLLDGIGNTIRLSLAADPIEAVRCAKNILKCLHLYTKEPEVIACPTCGRTEINLIKLAQEVERKLMDLHRRGRLKKPIKVSVMGCVVNGPGEAAEADFGIAGGRGKGAIFRKGKIMKWVEEKKLVDELVKIISPKLKAQSSKSKT